MLLKPLATCQAYAEQRYGKQKHLLPTYLTMVKQLTSSPSTIEMTIYRCVCSILVHLQELALGEGLFLSGPLPNGCLSRNF
jgi:hypothetical protein